MALHFTDGSIRYCQGHSQEISTRHSQEKAFTQYSRISRLSSVSMPLFSTATYLNPRFISSDVWEVPLTTSAFTCRKHSPQKGTARYRNNQQHQWRYRHPPSIILQSDCCFGFSAVSFLCKNRCSPLRSMWPDLRLH